MARRISVGIDVGTYQIKVVVAEQSAHNRQYPSIIGTGYALSKGMRHGYIINQADVARGLNTALAQAEEASGIKIKSAYLSVGGVGLEEFRARGETAVGKADAEVTDLDVSSALQESERTAQQNLQNRRIIHVIPLAYKLDGAPVLGRPQGMQGRKLEVDTLFITTLEQHLQDLISVIEDAGVSVIDVMASPLAASFVTLTKAQKMAGCVLANIGAETVSVVIFEDNIPISLKVFPIGSTDITHDIALGLRVSLEDAEQIKRGALIGGEHPRKKLDEIIAARLSDIFELIDAHLTKIGKNGLLPAGVIITGGGSGVATIEDLARSALKLPSKRASLQLAENAKIKDASWAVAYGLTIWGFQANGSSFGLAAAREAGRSLLAKITGWFKQFLP